MLSTAQVTDDACFCTRGDEFLQSRPARDQMRGDVRFPFLAVPAEGETIYSVLCRTWERSGIHQTKLLDALTGQPLVRRLFATVPAYLHTLSRLVPVGHPWVDISNTINSNTLFPYLSYFDTTDQRESATQVWEGHNPGQGARLTLGLQAYERGLLPRSPRFCPECIVADDLAEGFSYFHREHQVPGVAVCWLHGSVLAHGCVKCGSYPLRDRALSMAGRCLCTKSIKPLPAFGKLPADRDILQWIANESAYMVASDGSRVACVRERFRHLAAKNGFGSIRNLSKFKFARAMERRFGGDILSWVGYPPWTDRKPSPWIGRFLSRRGYESRTPALVFLLFVGLFADSVESFDEAATHITRGSCR